MELVTVRCRPVIGLSGMHAMGVYGCECWQCHGWYRTHPDYRCPDRSSGRGGGYRSIPLAGFEWKVISLEPVAAFILCSDTTQGCEDNFLHSIPDYRCVNQTSFSTHLDEKNIHEFPWDTGTEEKRLRYFTKKKLSGITCSCVSSASRWLHQ